VARALIDRSVNNVVEGFTGRLVTARNHVSPLSFDLDGDGFAEKVGWIDADDGQLAIDTNGGIIIVAI